MKKLPQGCDYQGRYPEAAEPCTEIGADQDYSGNDRVARKFVVAVLLTAGAFALAMSLAWWVR